MMTLIIFTSLFAEIAMGYTHKSAFEYDNFEEKQLKP